MFKRESAPAPGQGQGPTYPYHGTAAMLREGRFAEVDTFLAGLDWDTIEFCLSGMVKEDLPFDAWAEQSGTATAWTAKGMRLVRRGFDARGGGRAAQVTHEGVRGLHELCARGENAFERARLLDPDSPLPWVADLHAATGLGYQSDHHINLFNEANRRGPGIYQAHHRMVLNLSEKWYGSHELCYDFARQAHANLPEGSPAHAVIAQAHVERWLHYSSFEGDEGAAHAHVTDPRVVAEVRAAAMRSVLSPQASSSWRTADALNHFAFYAVLAGDRPFAAEMAKRIGAYVTDSPWEYLGNPVESYHRSMRRLLG